MAKKSKGFIERATAFSSFLMDLSKEHVQRENDEDIVKGVVQISKIAVESYIDYCRSGEPNEILQVIEHKVYKPMLNDLNGLFKKEVDPLDFEEAKWLLILTGIAWTTEMINKNENDKT